MTKLFIDNFLDAPEDFYVTRSIKESISFMEKYGCPDFINFNDFLVDGSSIEIIERIMIWDSNLRMEDKFFIPNNFKFETHGCNVISDHILKSKFNEYLIKNNIVLENE